MLRWISENGLLGTSRRWRNHLITESQSHLCSYITLVYSEEIICGHKVWGILSWHETIRACPVQLTCVTEMWDLLSPNLSGWLLRSKTKRLTLNFCCWDPRKCWLLLPMGLHNKKSGVCSLSISGVLNMWLLVNFQLKWWTTWTCFGNGSGLLNERSCWTLAVLVERAERSIAKETDVLIENCALSLAHSDLIQAA